MIVFASALDRILLFEYDDINDEDDIAGIDDDDGNNDYDDCNCDCRMNSIRVGQNPLSPQMTDSSPEPDLSVSARFMSQFDRQHNTNWMATMAIRLVKHLVSYGTQDE